MNKKPMSNKANPAQEKSYAFALRIVNLYKHLVDERKEYVLSKISIPDSGFARSGSVRGFTGSSRFNLAWPNRRLETCRSDAISVPGWTRRRAAQVHKQVY